MRSFFSFRQQLRFGVALLTLFDLVTFTGWLQWPTPHRPWLLIVALALITPLWIIIALWTARSQPPHTTPTAADANPASAGAANPASAGAASADEASSRPRS